MSVPPPLPGAELFPAVAASPFPRRAHCRALPSPPPEVTARCDEAAREAGRNEVIKIWSRRSTILPQFVGLTFGVYNGKKHVPVLVSEDMIGQKFGEYSPTRTYYGHAADKKAKRK